MSLATQLRRSGYHTILAGKYLNAYERVWPKVPPGWSEFHAFDRRLLPATRCGATGRRRWYGHAARDYSTDVITRKILGIA